MAPLAVAAAATAARGSGQLSELEAHKLRYAEQLLSTAPQQEQRVLPPAAAASVGPAPAAAPLSLEGLGSLGSSLGILTGALESLAEQLDLQEARSGRQGRI